MFTRVRKGRIWPMATLLFQQLRRLGLLQQEAQPFEQRREWWRQQHFVELWRRKWRRSGLKCWFSMIFTFLFLTRVSIHCQKRKSTTLTNKATTKKQILHDFSRFAPNRALNLPKRVKIAPKRSLSHLTRAPTSAQTSRGSGPFLLQIEL